MTKATNPTNVQWFDTLRALATIGVIVIHVTSPVLNMTFIKNMQFWWVGNVVESFVRFPVPLFLMLSGATMLGKEYPLGEFYKKRFMRVLVPFLFWMVVYWVFRWNMLMPSVQPKTVASTFSWAIDLFLKEGISKHFWYIYMILFIYLFLPFLGKALRKLNNPTILLILLGWFILCFISKKLPLSFYNWTENYHYKLLGYFLYTGYLVLGYYLAKVELSSIKIRYTSIIAFVITALIAAIYTYVFSTNSGKLDQSIYGYLTTNTIIQSASIFLIFKNFSVKNNFILRIQNTISNYSYGIYLVHIMIIGILFRNGIYWSFAHPLLSLPLLTLMVLFSSFGIIFVLRKIPGGKYISG